MVNVLLHRCCAAQIDLSRKIRPLWLYKTVYWHSRATCVAPLECRVCNDLLRTTRATKPLHAGKTTCVNAICAWKHCTEKVGMGHGKGHFGPFPLLTPSSIHFPFQPLPTRYFAVISPPSKTLTKKLTFRHSQPHLPHLWAYLPPPSKTLTKISTFWHPTHSPFKDPCKLFCFLS